MNDIKVIAFDCDGVMFDSAAANTAYYNQILAHFSMPEMTPSQFAYAHMHTTDESLAHLFQAPQALEAAQAYRKSITYFPFIKLMEIEPHLKMLLNRLRPGLKTAVATNRTDTMDRVITDHGLEGLFDLVITTLDVANPKPHPDPILKVMDHFQAAPSQTIYIGDSKVDEIAAKTAGTRFVAFQNPDLSADVHIESLKEMIPLLGL